MNKLSSRVAIITGGASGIGSATASLFLNEGASVVIADINKERLSEFREKHKSLHSNLVIHHIDVTDNSLIDAVVETTVKHFGRIDILMNNAGVMDDFDAVGDVDDVTWERVIRINLHAPFKWMKKVLPHFLAQKKGNIINVASIGGLHAGRAGAAYTASKYGLIGLTQNTGYMYAKSGIRCNAIAPGGVNTHISESIHFDRVSSLANERIMSGLVLNPRMGEPEEIADVALFLASEDARYVNAAVIVADGGWSAY
jgi:NAD(P)-dependent dehydrogenase (short-subunit alcohol dehydrogenase family)